jgi:hypothetical protein
MSTHLPVEAFPRRTPIAPHPSPAEQRRRCDLQREIEAFADAFTLDELAALVDAGRRIAGRRS